MPKDRTKDPPPTFLLPADVRRSMEPILEGADFARMINPATVLYRLPFKRDTDRRKKEFLDAFCRMDARFADPWTWAQRRAERRLRLMNDLDRDGRRLRVLEGVAPARLAIGLSIPHLYRSGFSLSMLYGYPFIPGRALKGVIRQHAFLEVAERLGVGRLDYNAWADRNLDEQGNPKKSPRLSPLQRLDRLLSTPWPVEGADAHDQRRLLEAKMSMLATLKGDLTELGWKSEISSPTFDLSTLRSWYADFLVAFGSQSSRGLGVFFGGIIIHGRYGQDVVNPHHRDYYEGRTDSRGGLWPPADWYSPKPHAYLVLEPGARIRIFLGLLEAAAEATVERLLDWTVAALRLGGVGAKTTLGYGRIDV